tara:strand:- start:492 stop:899 length:408 start_codon:yes stop_codon:yes gene_type:complete
MDFLKKNWFIIIGIVFSFIAITSGENLGLIIAYLLVASATLTILVFGVKKAFDATNRKKTMYKIGGLFVIGLISYFLASQNLFLNDEIKGIYDKYGVTSATSKQVGMGLWIFYIVLTGAIVSIIASPFLSKSDSK